MTFILSCCNRRLLSKNMQKEIQVHGDDGARDSDEA
jgi:hypothetical protein